MLLEVPWLVLGDQVVECSCEEGEVAVVVICNRIGQSLVL